MEKEQRNRLQKATQDARKLLEEEFRSQLLQTYDIDVDKVRWAEEPGAHLQAEQRLIREKLIAWIEHRSAQINDRKEALLLALREMAFTALNRFVALMLMEARELVRPCVSGGLESDGFQEFTAVAQGLLADQEAAYRLYLETIFEDVGQEVRVLFDPRDPASALWPRRTALLELLAILNRPELTELWLEDETIGWIYQYFNGNDVKEMRDAAKGGAPRNSRELAVRNQFFTPRYVVEFLTDNTLGRIWCEMRQGRTCLRERCRYLVSRPTEIFLTPDEAAPQSAGDAESDANLTQEELLRQPIHIPHRPLKDPREIRLLDPACGSMHFGLYAFDLFSEIYAEAWEIADGQDELTKTAESFAPFKAYAASFSDKTAFLREVPRLILENNIHGIDIDPRAAQIAGLSLWLRAQRAWQQAGVAAAERPYIKRSNVVCAEPMPGEKELLREFIELQFPAEERHAFAFLIGTIIEAMTLAGEAGSLLRIEDDIRSAIAEAKRLWKQGPSYEQPSFLLEPQASLNQAEFRLDLSGITDEQFWLQAEQRIFAALELYARQAESSSGFQRRLFADDAAQSFAFIDLCRKRYDVVVMNPPFGEASIASRRYLYATISSSTQDLFAAFVERFAPALAPGGRMGVISNRLAFFKELLSKWRDKVILGKISSLVTAADLGYGVLDAAVVEAAAYVVEKSAMEFEAIQSSFFTVLDSTGDQELLKAINLFKTGEINQRSFVHRIASFVKLPNQIIAFWCSDGWLNRIAQSPSAVEKGVIGKKGLETGDDYRFVRLSWEVCTEELLALDEWTPYSKGGGYRPLHSDLHLVFDYRQKSLARRISNEELYGLPGLTYTERTTSNFAARILPEDSVFSPKGPGIFIHDKNKLWGLLGFLNSSTVGFFIELFVGGGDTSAAGTAARDFSPSLIERLPVPESFLSLLDSIGESAKNCHLTLQKHRVSETSPDFRLDRWDAHTFDELAASSFSSYESDVISAIESYLEIESAVNNEYSLSKDERLDLQRVFGRAWSSASEIDAQSKMSIEAAFLGKSPLGDEIEPDAESTSRVATKLSFIADSRYENLATLIGTTPKEIAKVRQGLKLLPPLMPHSILRANLSILLGCIFGRWDIRYVTGERNGQEFPDPFARLPVCPPGMLQGDDGLPLLPEAGRQLRAEGRYPLDVAWDGILVDDPEHPLDLERRVHNTLELVWGDRTDAIQQEACELLAISNLRDWFSRPANFFADHLKSYSKSRRQAPIYWQLSVGSGSYSVWLYYHRFTQDTLYRVLRDFVEPRIQQTEREQFDLETQGALSGDGATRLQEAQVLLEDLRILRNELDLVAPLWNPNLNDGVIINHAILWRITPYTPWQKKCKECWDKLVKGDYDWAHLAFRLWPERVIPKCTTDRSLAIAHGLEERLWQETNNGNWLPRQLSETDLQALIAEHSKPAVKNALERFLAAPPPVAPTRTRAPRATRSSTSGTTRKPRGTATVVDAEASRQTLLALTAAPAEGLSRNAIAELLGVEAASLTAVIKQLKEAGQIEQLGAARGARYVLTEAGQAAVASQSGEDD